MIADKISIKIIDKCDIVGTNISWPLEGLEFVEDLISSVLESEGVTPIHRILFGLKLVDEAIWFAPNFPVKKLIQWMEKETERTKPKLELKLRFRPSSFLRVLQIDRDAFDLIYAQIRYDFLQTRFNEEKRDFVLLNESVLALVNIDLIRHAVENDLQINGLLKQLNPEEFVPRRSAKWQRILIFGSADVMNLQKSLNLCYNNHGTDVYDLKQRFLRIFLTKVAPNYGSEVYLVKHINNEIDSQLGELRVRYQLDSDESNCLIEIRRRPSNKRDHIDWEQVCDIETINHGTLRNNIVQLARLNGCAMRFMFESSMHARSFVSAIDGYYRLIRKWNFNFCREIISPQLQFLRSIRCHGPIGFRTSYMKLQQSRRAGSYLVRKCIKSTDRYLLDTLVSPDVTLTIDIDWDRGSKVFRVVGHSVTKEVDVSVTTGLGEFKTLKDLVMNTHVWIKDNTDRPYAHALIHWLPPGEYDDYPAILLSMSMKKLKAIELDEQDDIIAKSRLQYPAIIDNRSIKLLGELNRSSNGLIVNLARLNNERDVVSKSYIKMGPTFTRSKHDMAFYHCDGQEQHNQDLEQSKRSVWIYMRHFSIAETIGLDTSYTSMIQEYFPLGPLDKFLEQNNKVSPVFRLSVAFQLSQALAVLREKQFIHGKIRCHNIYIKQFNPIQVKLSDPLGSFDAFRDQAFVPVEHHAKRGKFCLRQYESGIDVWAFGTTLWQIYSNGARPPAGRFANDTLRRPKECPDDIWHLIESCWIVDHNRRASPQSLFRDLNDLFAWEKDAHDYFYVDQESDDLRQNTLSGENSNVCPSSDTALTLDRSPLREANTNGSTGEPNDNSEAQLIRLPDQSIGSSTNSNTTTGDESSGWMVYDTKTLETSHQHDLKGYLSKRLKWTNLINFKRRHLTRVKKSLDHHHHHHRNGNNQTSLGSGTNIDEILGLDRSPTLPSLCPTPSGSDTTKLTDVDLQSLSVAFDHYVWQVDSRRLKLGPEIGRGSSGVVIKGVLQQIDGTDEEQVVAVKCIDRENFNMNKIEDLRREFDILKDLDHKNIVKTLGYTDDNYSMMLIFEYMPLGSLLSYVVNSYHDTLGICTLPLIKYSKDIATGMEYLESMRIVHRDLALRNILVKSHDEVKICDFGLAQSLGADNHYKLKTERALPLKWYAPETLTTWQFTHKSDVWSYGVLLWEMYSGGSSPQYPGTYANLAETLKHERLPKPKGCPDQMYELMLKCWAYNPEDRCTFSHICTSLDNFIRSSQLNPIRGPRN